MHCWGDLHCLMRVFEYKGFLLVRANEFVAERFTTCLVKISFCIILMDFFCLCCSGYWETLLQQLKAFMAKARLKERHQKLLKSKLNEMKMEVSIHVYSMITSVLSIATVLYNMQCNQCSSPKLKISFLSKIHRG